MSVPNPITFTPFDPLSAAELNQMRANEDALAAGTALDTGAIATAKIADGAVTPVKWTNPYKFSAYKNPDQATVSTGTKITYDQELFDTNGNFASSTYTVPVTGFYQIYASVYVASLNGNARTQIYKNGSVLRSGNWQYDLSDGTPVISCFISLTAGDTLEVYLTFTGGGSRTIIGHTNVPGYPTVFEGHLVSQA